MLYNWLPKKVKRVQPYEKLAHIYDFVMRHVDYDLWAEYVLNLLMMVDRLPSSLLDVSCGTGSFLSRLKWRVPELYGFDGSLAMVAQARKKDILEGIPLWVGDMRRFGLRRKVDTVVCLYDSINYLLNIEAVQLALENFYEITTPRGVLVFDICTIQNSELNFANYYESKKEKTFSYTRWSHYDRESRIQFTEFHIKFKGDGTAYHEIHRQRIYPIEQFVDVIEKTPWKLRAALDGFSRDPASRNSNRVHFLLTK